VAQRVGSWLVEAVVPVQSADWEQQVLGQLQSVVAQAGKAQPLLVVEPELGKPEQPLVQVQQPLA
jgi:hypothetical protein